MNNLMCPYRGACKRIFLTLPILLVFLLPVLWAGCSQAAPRLHSRSGLFFGGIPCSIKIYEQVGKPLQADFIDQLFDRIFKSLDDIDKKMSFHLPDSEVSKINAAAGKQAVPVSPDTFKLIAMSQEYSRQFDGRFDISVGPLVQLWGIGTEKARLPAPAEIQEKLACVDYKKIKLDQRTQEVMLAQAGMSIDLGAVAKGFATDEVVKILKEAGIGEAIIDLGGNIMVMGQKANLTQPGGKAQQPGGWRVGIRHPLQHETENDIIGILTTSGQSVVTSGVYERFFIADGKHYHHILDTRTGYPVENSLVSVTIITPQSTLADVCSTGVFTLGLAEGRRFIENMPDMEAIFVTKDKEVYLSSGIKAGNFELLDKTYKLISE